jgi:hypothetical protein
MLGHFPKDLWPGILYGLQLLETCWSTASGPCWNHWADDFRIHEPTNGSGQHLPIAFVALRGRDSNPQTLINSQV